MSGFASVFPRKERLLHRKDFIRLSSLGKSVRSTNFLILYSASAQCHTRVGLTVSRKVGNAVVRNRIKRYLREYYRLHKFMFDAADYNIIARQGAAQLHYSRICAELDKSLRRLQNSE